MRILVVSADQDELSRCTSALALVPGAEVTTATSTHAARAELTAAPVDVLVIDGDLRPKGGYSLLYELAADADLAGTSAPPSVVLVERKEDHFLADWAKANATCRKPVDPFELGRLVQGLAAPAPA
jgi:CheY-like chemotaxis protein